MLDEPDFFEIVDAVVYPRRRLLRSEIALSAEPEPQEPALRRSEPSEVTLAWIYGRLSQYLILSRYRSSTCTTSGLEWLLTALSTRTTRNIDAWSRFQSARRRNDCLDPKRSVADLVEDSVGRIV